MSRNLSRVVLAAGLLVGGLSFSSCSQDGSPRMEETDSVNYTRVPLSFSNVEAVVQPLEESSARALSLELNENKKMLPKVKGLKDGTKVLCVIRSSVATQPVNYIQATWTKKENTTNPTYTLTFDGEISGTSHTGTGFSFDKTKSLGKLSMMIIAGGEWDAATKQLKVSPELVRAEGTTMEYDMPYVSEWRPLDYAFKNGKSDPSSLSIALKDHDPNATNVPQERYTMKPVGMLLRMPVEEELAENGGGRYQLNGITIRSTSFGGHGYFDLSESHIKALQSDVVDQKGRSYRSWWNFSIPADGEKFDVKNPTIHTFENDVLETYGTRRLKKYKPRYYLFLWVMPRNQQPDDVTAGKVSTEIFADVDVKPANTDNVVWANSSSADELNLQGYAVVPHMKALPVYASDRLVVKNNANAAFVEGTSYTLTLNLNRPDLPLELVSQWPVNSSYNGFAKRKEDAAYLDNQNPELATLENTFRSANGDNWSIPSLERFSMLLGSSSGYGSLSPNASPLYKSDPSINPDTYADAGNYGVNKFDDGRVNVQRMLLGFHSTEKNGKVVLYTLLFYPSMVTGSRVYDRTANRLCILRNEYVENSPYGGPAYKLTLRYIGGYSNDIGILDPNMPETDQERKQFDAVAAALQKIIDKGDDYWNDNLRRQDDITRYFPLWQKDPATGKTYAVGEAGYTWANEMAYMPFDASRTGVYYGKLGVGYSPKDWGLYSRLDKQGPMLIMRDRLTRK